MTQATKTPVTIAYGDGIGPEIMTATLNILEVAGAKIDPQVIEVGEKVYLDGNTSGIPAKAWQTIMANPVFLKSPITTPQGGGYKSLNVTLRKTLGLYANVRPCFAYNPYVPAKCQTMDLVIVRENEEDLYAGIEHRQTENVYQCLKLITRDGCEKIIRFAFQYAKKFNRKKVTCFTKDNIMKMTDGLFHQVFNEIAEEYPDIEHTHLIVDIGTALLATDPARFDVIVTLNLYGDIISDVAAQVAGSVGLAGSANIGTGIAMFEAIHGSAPDIAGKDIANPSGLLNAAIQMLVHINQPDVATLIENAWLKTIEDGIHTADIFNPEHSKEKVGTQGFAKAVIDRLGQKPTYFKPANYLPTISGNLEEMHPVNHKKMEKCVKKLVGVDIFIDNTEKKSPNRMAEQLSTVQTPLKLMTLSSRGLKIWPEMDTHHTPNACIINAPNVEECVARFQADETNHKAIIDLLAAIDALNMDVVKTENLYLFNGIRGFSLAQGQ